MAKAAHILKRPVGLREIANELNVSVSLVSKVLSGRLGTSGANKEKIRAIHAKAREMNFRKNQLAEALRTGRQNVYAVFIHRQGAEGSMIVDDTIAGIAEEAALHRQRLLIHYYETREEFRVFSPLVDRTSVDGVIVAGLSHSELIEDLRGIRDRGVPIVTVHDTEIDKQFANVGVDQAQVTFLSTLHLIDQGCRRLAHFRVADGPTSLPADRFAGYRKALQTRGIKFDPALVFEVPDFSHGYGLDAVNRLVASGVSFDGIVGQSDQLAVAALNYLVLHGRKVPQEVKLIGVDNAPFCKYSIVPLSSVSQRFRERGQLAVQLLAKNMEGESVHSVQLEPSIVVRASST